MNEIAILERLVQAGEVFELLAREYDRRGGYANFEVCRKVALDMLIARLKDGFLDAWSTTCNVDSTIDTGRVSAEQIVARWDYYHHEGMPEKVPREFWAHYYYAGENNRSFDTIAGDFRFAYTDDEYSHRDGSAYEVFFDPRGLPGVAVPSLHGSIDTMPEKQSPALLSQGTKGRKPANWWPDFAEELAMYVHEHGFPTGHGSEGQSQMIDAIFRCMIERGKPEPARSTVQPVINAVLRRFRSAEK